MTRKYKVNLKQSLFIVLVAAVGFSGCKKYLDINQNPNNPDNVEPTLLLPTVEAALGQVVGNSFQIYGNIWAQYWTQGARGGQYKSIDQYNPVNTDFDYPWLNLYGTALVNADMILKNPASSANLKGIAYLMKAYGFQLATDAFGDVPLSQALQPTVYKNPKFEPQQAVYDSIFVYIQKALPLLAKQDAVSLGSQDLVFQGDPAQWTAFANTFELRAYLRLAKKDPATAKAGIAALYATNPVFLTADASINYSATGGNENPLYNTEVALSTANQNLVLSKTADSSFTANNDPRLGKFYTLFIKTPDSLRSIAQGDFNANINKFISPPSALVGAEADNPASATAPVKLMSAAESYFLQAEAVARTYATGSVPTLYAEGITASFTATGAGDPATYISSARDAMPALTNAGANTELMIKAIITQKYYAMCGFQGFEAWTDWRRTGYPNFFTLSIATVLGTKQMPMRMIYPNSEETSNSSYPGTVPVTTPVWWGM